MSVHSTATGPTAGIHVPYQWIFANDAARNSSADPNTGVVYTSAFLGRVCRQSDTNGLFMLVSTAPTWEPISPRSGTATLDGSGTVSIQCDTNTFTTIVASWFTAVGVGILCTSQTAGSFSIFSSDSMDAGKVVSWIAF